MKGTHISKRSSRKLSEPFAHLTYTYPERSPRLPPPPPTPSRPIGLTAAQTKMFAELRAHYREQQKPDDQRKPIKPGVIRGLMDQVYAIYALVEVIQTGWRVMERKHQRNAEKKRRKARRKEQAA